jgi:hypothetical protein
VHNLDLPMRPRKIPGVELFRLHLSSKHELPFHNVLILSDKSHPLHWATLERVSQQDRRSLLWYVKSHKSLSPLKSVRSHVCGLLKKAFYHALEERKIDQYGKRLTGEPYLVGTVVFEGLKPCVHADFGTAISQMRLALKAIEKECHKYQD